MIKDKTFSVITIVLFCSIIFIPIAIVLMWFYTNWKKKLKIILSVLSTILYIAIITLFLNLESFNKSQNFINSKTSGYSNSKNSEKDFYLNDGNSLSLNYQSDEPKNSTQKTVSSPVREINFKGRSSVIYPILFFLFMLLIIIAREFREKKKSRYENPYVDTKLYKLPLDENSKIPIVHFLRLKLKPNEKIIFATKTTQKNNEGDFVVTNQRVVIFSKEQNVEFPLKVLTAVSSVSNSVMLLTSGERKYYIFMDESQLKYALATVRFAYKIYVNY